MQSQHTNCAHPRSQQHEHGLVHEERRSCYTPHRLSTYQKAPRVPIVVRSGLVRHEMCLVDVNYCKETRPALPPTVLIHYFNPEVETEENLLSLSSPNPLCGIIYREAQAGVSSMFRSGAEVEREVQDFLTEEQALEFADDACVEEDFCD